MFLTFFSDLSCIIVETYSLPRQNSMWWEGDEENQLLCWLCLILLLWSVLSDLIGGEFEYECPKDMKDDPFHHSTASWNPPDGCRPYCYDYKEEDLIL